MDKPLKKNQPTNDTLEKRNPAADQLTELFSSLGELVYHHGELTAQLAGIEGAIEECRNAISTSLK